MSEASPRATTPAGEPETRREGLGRRRRDVLLAAAVVAGAALLLFARIVGFAFVNYDDGTNVFANPYLVPPTPAGLAHLWTHAHYDLYMPVTYTVWWLCAHVPFSGKPQYVPGYGYATLNPAAFHAASLALHAANALLVFALLRRLLPRPQSSPWPAALGALLFAVHPMQVESVAWVTGMNNLTGGFFGLLALLLYVCWAQADRPGSGGWLAAATGAFILALLSKPTAAALPLVVAALEWFVLRRAPARWIAPVAAWAALAAASAVVTHFTSSDAKVPDVPLWARPLVAGDALAYYLGKLVWPLRTSINVGRTVPLLLGHWWGYVTWTVPLLLAALLWAKGRNAPYLRGAFTVFAAALLPMLGFVPFYAMLYTTVSDRYLYVALLGPALALAWFVDGAPRPPRPWRVGLAVAALVLLAARTTVQLSVWQDSDTLTRSMIAVNPGDALTQTNYAISLAEHGRLADALPHFREAARLEPDNAVNRYHLGVTLADTGDLEDAVEPLEQAVRLDPGLAEAQMRLGATLAKLGRTDDAVGPLQKAAALRPQDPGPLYILGVILGNAHRDAEAEAALARVVALDPSFPKARQSLDVIRQRLREASGGRPAGAAKP